MKKVKELMHDYMSDPGYYTVVIMAGMLIGMCIVGIIISIIKII